MDLSYKSLLASAYAGFYVDPPSALPDTLHHRVRKALHDLTRRGFFTFDVLQTNSAVSCTFVRRTLVGDLGSTYHYQGLRLFAHPWVGKHGGAAAPSLRVVSDLNDTLKRVAQPHLAAEARRLPAGRPTTSTEWSVSLINFMDPDDPLAPALREEPAYGMGRTSVSWHSDSSLQPNSTIAVYHCTAAASDWRVGLRCLGTAAADVPAVRLPLADVRLFLWAVCVCVFSACLSLTSLFFVWRPPHLNAAGVFLCTLRPLFAWLRSNRRTSCAPTLTTPTITQC